MQLTRHFTLDEMTGTATGLANVPNATERGHLVALCQHVLQPLRDALGQPVIVNSAFRSEAVNRAVGGVSSSQHRLGQAADIRADGLTPPDLAAKIVALGLPYDQLISEPGWVHVSYSARHRRQVLTARRQNGRVVYSEGLSR